MDLDALCYVTVQRSEQFTGRKAKKRTTRTTIRKYKARRQ